MVVSDKMPEQVKDLMCRGRRMFSTQTNRLHVDVMNYDNINGY
jgi:hypothetical protein